MDRITNSRGRGTRQLIDKTVRSSSSISNLLEKFCKNNKTSVTSARARAEV